MFARRAIQTSRPLCLRFTSTTTETKSPPLLLKIRADLKTAMRAKDTTRLIVLRSLLSSTLNASKTSRPLTTTTQVLSLIRKNIRASQDAATQFRENGREDLAVKEEGQIGVLEELEKEGEAEMVGVEEIMVVVRRIYGEVCKEGENDVEMKVKKAVMKFFREEGKEADWGLIVDVVGDFVPELADRVEAPA